MIYYPKQLDIEVTSKCNLKCKYCPQWKEGAHAVHMEPALFYSIVDRVNFPCTIVPWLNGEPLLHPEYYNFIKYITDRELPCYITTNGTIWNDRLFEHLTGGSSCYQIIFSLDGLDIPQSRSIEKARPGSNRREILTNIYRFIELKKAKGAKIDIALKLCRRGQDYEEIENYIAYWLSQTGVDYVCIGDDLRDDNTDGMRIFPCQYSDTNFMVIKSDGRLTLCAYNDRMTNDPQYAVGQLDLKTPLLTLYNSEKYTQFRENQNRGIFNPPCDTCGFAYTGQGIEGEVEFRNPLLLPGKRIFYHGDYYNSFYSLTKKWKTRDYYKQGYVRDA